MKWVLMTPDTLIQPRANSSTHRGIGQQRLTKPAVLLGDHQAEQPHLAHRIDDRLRVLVGVFERLGVRDDLLVHELSHGVDHLGLNLGEPGGLGQARHAATRSNTAAKP